MTPNQPHWNAPDGLYFRYGAALHDADDHSCQLGDGVQYSLLLGAITSIRDEEMEQLRKDLDMVTKSACRDSEDLHAAQRELAEARATIVRVRDALMNQSFLVSLDESIDAFAHELAEEIRAEAMKYPTLRGGAYMRQATYLIDPEVKR